MQNIIELIRIQNSLNFQEEKDKNSIALVGGQESDKQGTEFGSKEEAQAKKFVRRTSLLQYKAGDADDKLKESAPAAGAMAHVEIQRTCQICQADQVQRHAILKAMKLACLKYQSGSVTHYGKQYDRMKLIKVQEDLIDQHARNIKTILKSKQIMETGGVGEAPNFDIRVQDHGISLGERKAVKRAPKATQKLKDSDSSVEKSSDSTPTAA